MRFRAGVGLVLESGHKISIQPTLSLTADGTLTTGYETTLEETYPEDAPDGRMLTEAEKEEIGLGMARRWMRWAGYELPLLALTVRQPFADCIIYGGKGVENRNQAGPRAPVWIAIAAGLNLYEEKGPAVRVPPPGWDDDGRANSPEDIGGVGWKKTDTLQSRISQLWPDCPDPAGMTRGAIVGVAHYTGSHLWTPGRYSGNAWATGPWCWEFDRVVALDAPIPHKGAQGLHRVADAATPWLLEAVRRAA